MLIKSASEHENLDHEGPDQGSLPAALLVAGAAALILLASTAVTLSDVDYEASGFRRLRADQAFAIASSLHDRYPRPPPGLGGAPWDPDIDLYYHAVLTNQVRAAAIRPWQPWRRVRDRPLLRAHGPCDLAAHDDPGRARLLALGFRLLRGVAPFLVFWLGPLAMALALAWMVWESVRAARGRAGWLFAVLLAASPYVVETLSLPRSAVGFHLIALVLLLALALPAQRPRAPTWWAWLVRAALAGLGFAVCALCRSGVLALLPMFLLAVLGGAWRSAAPLGRARRAALLLVACGLLVTPYLLLRPTQRHDLWAGVWEGLGDYDRTKGHIWSDRAAGERVWRILGHAGTLPRHGGDALVEWLNRPESAAALRRDVLDHVRDDPSWYARILLRRTWATLSLEPLRVKTTGGAEVAAPRAAAHAWIDKYWRYTTQADWLGVGPLRARVPVAALAAPLLLLVAWRRRRAGADSPLWVLGLLTLAVLALPVGVTTASGTEPQAMVLTFYLAAAYLADESWRALRRRARAGPAGSC